MKTKSIVTFAFLFHWTVSCLFGASAVVTNLSYSQRKGTKLVDINYKLNLTAGDNAEVGFLFSHDDGRSFPVACSSVSGDVGKVHSSGAKRVVWDAGKDWNLKFTDRGRIKIVWEVDEGKPPIDFDVARIPFKTSGILASPSELLKIYFTPPPGDPNPGPGPPRTFFADKYEVTNWQWDKVVDWAIKNGYDLKKAPAGASPNLPRVSVSCSEVVKWLNARSEMEGKKPVYYQDPQDCGWDMNGDGRIANVGSDTLYLTGPEHDAWLRGEFDLSLIVNLPPYAKDHMWINFDPNNNGKLDPGEPFVDRNRNGRFEPKEIEMDWNGNGKFDGGLKFPFRTGDIAAWVKPWLARNGDSLPAWSGWSLNYHVNHTTADGYRLPDPWVPMFGLIAMGGRAERGSWGTGEPWWEWWQGIDPKTGEPIPPPLKTGIWHDEEWPWGGSQSLEKVPDLYKYAVTPLGDKPASAMQPVASCLPNGMGIHDMIGNAAEMSSEWKIWNTPEGSKDVSEFVDSQGFSWKKFPDPSGGPPDDPWGNPTDLTPGSILGYGMWWGGLDSHSPAGSPELGFRGYRMQY